MCVGVMIMDNDGGASSGGDSSGVSERDGDHGMTSVGDDVGSL